jgi:hypothetical protein
VFLLPVFYSCHKESFFQGYSFTISCLGYNKVNRREQFDNKDLAARRDLPLGIDLDCLDKILEFTESKGIELNGDRIQPNPYVFVLDPNGLKIKTYKICKIHLEFLKVDYKYDIIIDS